MAVSKNDKSELFNLTNVSMKMDNIEEHFSSFADTLNTINGLVQSEVNAGLGSAAFGDLGGKLINIWNSNASTFNDFHENFDNWSKVVAIISAHNSEFAVDAAATYRDSAGTLDGVQEARDFVARSNGLSNISSTSGYDKLSPEARDVIDGAYKAITRTEKNNNTYGGKTVSYVDSAGNKIEEYYDADGNYVGKKVTDKNGHTDYYNSKDVKTDKLPSKSEYNKEKEEKKTAMEEYFKKNDSYYKNHLDDLKFGEFTREVINVDGEEIACYVYKPDYGTEVTGLPVMMYMTGQSMEGNGEGIVTYGGLGGALQSQSVTPSGLVVIPYVPDGYHYESKEYRDKLNKIPSIIAEKYNGDTNRMSIGGCSYGGVAAYKIVDEHPDTYAAVVTAAGANDVTSAFNGVSVVNFLPDGNSGSEHTNPNYIKGQSNAVNRAGGNSQTIKIDGQYGHTNVANYGFWKKYDFDGDGKEEYVFEWAFDHTLNGEDTYQG